MSYNKSCANYPVNNQTKRYVGGVANNGLYNSYQDAALTACGCGDAELATVPYFGWNGVYANSNDSTYTSTTPQTFFATINNKNSTGAKSTSSVTYGGVTYSYSFPAGLYKGTNSGSTLAAPTLTYVSSLPYTGITGNGFTSVASSSDGNVILVGSQPATLTTPNAFLSTDGGDSWTNPTVNLYSSWAYNTIVVSNNTGSNLAILTSLGNSNSSLSTSSNYGSTWTQTQINIYSVGYMTMDESGIAYMTLYSSESDVYTFDTNNPTSIVGPIANIPDGTYAGISTNSSGSQITIGGSNYLVGSVGENNFVNNSPNNVTMNSSINVSNNTGYNVAFFNTTPNTLYTGYNSNGGSSYIWTPYYPTNQQTYTPSTPAGLASDNVGNLYTSSGQNLIQGQLNTNSYSWTSPVTASNVIV